jgi:hypothetical protein
VIEFFETEVVVTHGKLKLGARERQELDRAVSQFADGKISLKLEKEKQRRSNAQNRFWWGTVVKLFADHCGHYPDEMHEILKVELLPKEVEMVNPETGETKTMTIGRSTASLPKAEFKDLIHRAQELGASMGIYIPDPGEGLTS